MAKPDQPPLNATFGPSDPLLESIVEALPGAVFLADWIEGQGLDLTHAYTSPAVEALAGLSPEELRLSPGRVLDVVHPDDRKWVLSAMAEGLERREEVELTYRMRNATSGRMAHVLQRTKWIPSNSPGRTCIVGVLMDITSLRETQEELQRSRKRMQVLVEGTPYLFFYTQDADGVVTYVSPSVEQITGYTVSEWLGQYHWFITDNPINQAARDATWAHLRGDEPQGMHTIETRRRDGGKILLEVFEHPIVENGIVTGIQGVARDVTEQHRLQDALAEAQKMEAVGRLAAGLAHDFNNMLQGIVASAELAAAAVADESSQKWLSEILGLSRRGRDLIRQLLAYSRRQVLKPEPTNVNDVVREAAPLIQRLVGDDVSVRLDLAEKLPLISADTSQLMQVLLNLAANARNAMRTGGELCLATAAIPAKAGGGPGNPKLGYVELRVSDTGRGIQPDAIPLIFEPYFTTRRREGGTGLGLASVMGIVRQHQGTIDVTSLPEAGTTFRIRLPAAAAERRAVPRKISDEADIMSGSETVLLVEDHTEVRHALRDVLESMGYRVFAAATVAEALELIETQDLDLLLTDLQLPDGVGIDLIGPARRLHARLPAVLISGYARGSLPGVLGELPNDVAFVEKPVNTRTLAEALRRALSS